MEEAVFKTYIKGVYCVQCPELILTGLTQTRGVIDADVAYFQSQVSVKYDPDIVSEAELCHALADLGYPPADRRPLISERITDQLAHLLRGRSGRR